MRPSFLLELTQNLRDTSDILQYSELRVGREFYFGPMTTWDATHIRESWLGEYMCSVSLPFVLENNEMTPSLHLKIIFPINKTVPISESPPT